MHFMNPSTHRRRTAVLALAGAGLLFTATGCATLPTSTEPHVLHPFNDQRAPMPVEEPREGMEPDLLLREFFAASANPTGDFEAARRYMTAPMAEMWAPRDITFVLDSFDLTSRASTDQNKRSYSVAGRIVGYLLPGGAFQPGDNRQYEATMELSQQDGEWRIGALPNEVVIDRTDLRSHYEPRNLYYYDTTGQSLVSDRRWVYARVPSIETLLMNMLVGGPEERIAPAVRSAIPEDVAFTGLNDGIYEFTGLADADEQTRARFAAQVVWTLNEAGVRGPYSIKADGAALLDESVELTTDDFADLNPVPQPDGGPSLYTLSDGSIKAVSYPGGDDSEVESIPELDKIGDISHIDISDDGAYAAAVNVSEREQALVFGRLGSDGNNGDSGRGNSNKASSREVLRAESLTRPSLEPDHTAAWTVLDGQRVVRLDRSSTNGEVTVNDVEMSLPESLSGEISVLRLSQTGARVVMIIDGHLAVGVVERRDDGSRAVVNVVKYAATELGGAAVAVDWQPDGSLLVGTSIMNTPVYRLEMDGSTATALPSGNISGPVVALGATDDTMYITDSKVLMQMPVQIRENVNWREVPGQQGVRAAPVLPRP